MELHPVDAESAPPYPRRSTESQALRNLPGMQNRKQRGVDQQALRISHQLPEDLPSQRLQVAPELANPAMERGRGESPHPWEQMREEPLYVPQERALALGTPQLLEEGKRYDLRI